MSVELMNETLLPPSRLAETPVSEILRKSSLDGEGSLTMQVHRLLHSLIVNLHLMPNQILPEKDVAAILAISKTPVREAFIRLAEEGLVTIIPKIGTYVSPIDIRRALRGYFIRESLEAACAERIAAVGTEADFETLLAILDAQAAALRVGDFDPFYFLDNRFHSTLYDVAKLPTAKRLVDSVKSEVDRVKGLKSVYRVCRPESELHAEHMAIYEAMRRHDAAGARAAVKHHLSGMNDAIQAILKEEKLWGLFNSINQGTGNPRE